MTMIVRSSIRYGLYAVLLGLASHVLVAQSTLTSIGKPTGAAVFPIEHGLVDLSNGNVHLEIPIEGFKQRGDISVPAAFVYDSSIWAASAVPPGTGSWSPTNIPANLSAYDEYYNINYTGWRFNYLPNNAYSYAAGPEFACKLPSGLIDYLFPYEGFTWYDLKGTAHTFVIQTVDIKDYGCTNSVPYQDTPSGAAYATDGSGFYATITNYVDPTIWAPDGTQVASASAANVLIDRNGNCLACVTAGDTLGRNPISVTSGGTNSNGDPVEYLDVVTTGGQKARYTVTYESINLSTNFGVTGLSEFSGSAWTIASIGLPDGTSYSFSYENGSYGEMTGITLPHGGMVNLAYASNSLSGSTLPARWVNSHTGSNGTTTFSLATLPSFTNPTTGNLCQAIMDTVENSPSETQYNFQNCGEGFFETDEYYAKIFGSNLGTPSNLVAHVAKTYDYTHKCPNGGCTSYSTGTPLYQWINVTDIRETLYETNQTADIQYSYSTPGTGIPTTAKQWDFYAYPGSGPANPPSGTPTREVDQTLSYNVNGALFPTSTTYKDSTGTAISQITYTYDEAGHLVAAPSTTPNLTSPTGNRGNLTTLTTIDPKQGSSANRVSSFYYDTAGRIQSVTDPNKNVTTFAYDATDTFAITVTAPATGSVSHVVSKTYDADTGQITSYTDQNKQKTTYNYDSIGRLQSVQFGTITLATITHPSATETGVALQQSANASISMSRFVDNYGRKSRSLVSGISQEATYDSHGRLYSVTNPHISGAPAATDGMSYRTYDELGRILSVKNPSGQSKTYSYSGNTVTITDPLGHKREHVFDSFGDLTSVLEPDSTGALNWTTAYQYNGMGKITHIDQKGGSTNSSNWRTRTFTYDGFGEVTAQTTPEAGTLQVWYDNDGNVTQAQNHNSANNLVKNYYDALNRLTSRSIAGGPTYTYTYDGQDSSKDPYGVGQLTGTSNGSNVKTLWTHDAMGRIASTAYCLPSDCSFNYVAQTAHDYLGNITSLTYPDGRQVAWTYNLLNQPISETYAQWVSTSVNAPYVSNLSYTPTGQLQQATFGNGVQIGVTYDANLNLASFVATAKGMPILEKAYTWAANAANLASVSDIASGRTQTYSYDQLDRLSGMSDSGTTTSACNKSLPGIPSESQSYSIDAWGNLAQTGTFSFSQAFGTNNQVSTSGYLYDSAGNQTQDGLGNTYQYRADGLMSGSNGVVYTYDALSQRVRKDASASTEYFYLGGKLLAMRNPATGAWTDRIYGPSGTLATVPGTQTGSAVYRLVDHLGSLNYTTDASGNVLGAASALPFGQMAINSAGDNFLFTDHERDSENSTDHTLFRQYSFVQGRWTSPDPFNGSYMLTDPQSLNRYAYLTNRPMNAADRLGLDQSDPSSSDNGDDDDDDDGGGGGGGGDGGGGDGGGGDGGDGNPFPTDTSNVPICGQDTSCDGSGATFSVDRGGDAPIATGDSSDDSAPSDGGSTTVASGTGSDSIAGDLLLGGVMLLGNIPEIGGFANAGLAAYYAAKGQYGQAGLFAAASAASFLGVPGGSEIAEGLEALRAAEAVGETALEAGAEATSEASGFGTTAFGNEVHQGFGEVLADQTGTNPADWRMATAPGQTGVDATYVGPASRNPGFNFAELKPMGSSPYSVGNQVSNWGLPQGQTSIWWYNQHGIIGQTFGVW